MHITIFQDYNSIVKLLLLQVQVFYNIRMFESHILNKISANVLYDYKIYIFKNQRVLQMYSLSLVKEVV